MLRAGAERRRFHAGAMHACTNNAWLLAPNTCLRPAAAPLTPTARLPGAAPLQGGSPAAWAWLQSAAPRAGAAAPSGSPPWQRLSAVASCQLQPALANPLQPLHASCGSRPEHRGTAASLALTRAGGGGTAQQPHGRRRRGAAPGAPPPPQLSAAPQGDPPTEPAHKGQQGSATERGARELCGSTRVGGGLRALLLQACLIIHIDINGACEAQARN